jgi:predicted ATPase
MAVFVDGWTIEAAAQVADLDENRALNVTEVLARHSLIQLDSIGQAPRARMLETVREFVAERLGARPDVAEIEHRHASYYRALAERADRPLRGLGQDEWLDRLQFRVVGHALEVVARCVGSASSSAISSSASSMSRDGSPARLVTRRGGCDLVRRRSCTRERSVRRPGQCGRA